jgi:hypothetical protein
MCEITCLQCIYQYHQMGFLLIVYNNNVSVQVVR